MTCVAGDSFRAQSSALASNEGLSAATWAEATDKSVSCELDHSQLTISWSTVTPSEDARSLDEFAAAGTGRSLCRPHSPDPQGRFGADKSWVRTRPACA